MSEENVEIVRKLLNVWNEFMRGELTGEALAAPLDQKSCEMRWHDQQTYPDTPQLLRGLDEIIAFCEQYRDGWDDFAQEPLELTEAPAGRVLGLIRQSGKGRQSGVPIEIHFFQIWTIRDGRARKIELASGVAALLGLKATPTTRPRAGFSGDGWSPSVGLRARPRKSPTP